MNDKLKIENIEKKLIEIRDQKVLLDSDVAKLYGVETKRINEAVKNNHDKFPKEYIIELTEDEWKSLRSKIPSLKNKGRGKHAKFKPKAFTEKGLYMIATMLKSKTALKGMNLKEITLKFPLIKLYIYIYNFNESTFN